MEREFQEHRAPKYYVIYGLQELSRDNINYEFHCILEEYGISFWTSRATEWSCSLASPQNLQ